MNPQQYSEMCRPNPNDFSGLWCPVFGDTGDPDNEH